MDKFLMDEDGHLTRNPDYEKTPKSVYSVVCSRCGKSLGKTDEVPSIVVCLKCYYKKD